MMYEQGAPKKQTKRGGKKEAPTLSFEEKIWEAADLLRGNINASEYRNVVLGLIFLKYISDRFEAFHNELRLHEDADPYDRDEYRAENVFYVPEEGRWSTIARDANSADIGVSIDHALNAIESANPTLKGILPKNFARPELDKRRLGEVVNLFTNMSMHSMEEERDLLGRAYEYCLGKFAESEGKRGGEFYTPACIVKTIVEILQPYKGKVYDPACGSGGMFVQSASFIRNHSGSLRDISVYGQDANATTWKLARMNLAIRGIEANLGPYAADTFHEDLHKNLKADFIMANPPFNIKNWGADKLVGDVRWQYGLPTDGNANFAWLQHMVHHLGVKGRMGMVLANGSLTSNTNGEGEVRANIIKADLVDCIIALPTQLFYTTQIPVALWFLNKDKRQKGKTLFIDARNLGEMTTRVHRELTDADIAHLSQTYQAFEQGTLEHEKGFCAVVSTEKIAEQGYMLTPGRFVGIADAEEDSEPFNEKMSRLTSELSELFAEGHRLEAEIKQRLSKIGYSLI